MNVSRLTAVAVITAGLLCAACAGGVAASASDAPPAPGERVALALAEAREASASGDTTRLSRAVAVLDRAGAKPVDGWTGTDPVPAWREKLDPGAPPLRGSPLGPGYRCGQLLGGASDRFDQVFLSGRKAKIALSAPGNAPVALRIFDSQRKTVCTTSAMHRACNWVPLFTQRYTIEVINTGARNADYFIVVD